MMLIHNLVTVLTKRPALLLVPIWLLVHVFLYQWFGVKVVYDSHRYLAYANSLAEGSTFWYQSSSIFYSTYALLLFFLLHVLKLPLICVVLLQTVLSGVAAIYLYKTTFLQTFSRLSALLATFLFIVWPDLQSWNLYIHTESLYISLSVFILYLFVRSQQKVTDNERLKLLFLLLLIMFLRPNGLFLTAGIITAILIVRYKEAFFLAGKRLLLFIPLLLLLVVLILLLEVFSPLQYFINGQVIQGYNGITVTLNFPPAFDHSRLVIFQLMELFFHQPLQCLKLLLLRFLFFWGQIRPYYSLRHNLLIVTFFIPVYYLAITKLGNLRLRHPGITLMATLMLLHTLMVMAVSVDWDNRFIVPVLPFVFVLAGFGAKAGKIRN